MPLTTSPAMYKALCCLFATVFTALVTSAVAHAESDGYYLDSVDLPEIGDSSQARFSLNSQRRLGYNAYLSLLREGHISNDIESNTYIQNLGERVAAGTEQPLGSFTFFIIDSPSVNAFAMPGGFIGINAGLITLAETESEVASVIAHEINHVTQQHLARIYEASRPFQYKTWALMLAAIALSGGDSDVTQAAISAGLSAGIEHQVNFTRAHEHEADRLAVPLLVKANLNPKGMADFFHRLDRLRSNYSNELSGFLRTHPLTSTRVAEAEQHAAHYTGRAFKESELFPLIRQRLRVSNLRDDQNPLDLYPEATPQNLANRYGLATALERAGHLRDAEDELAALIAENEHQLLFHLDYLDVISQIGSNSEIEQALERSLKIFPDNRLLRLGQAQLLLQLRKAHEARALLQVLKAEQPNNALIHRLLARSAAMLRMQTDTHIHEANFYASLGALDLAEEQLKTALTIPNLNPVDIRRIKAHEQTIKERKARLEQP